MDKGCLRRQITPTELLHPSHLCETPSIFRYTMYKCIFQQTDEMKQAKQQTSLSRYKLLTASDMLRELHIRSGHQLPLAMIYIHNTFPQKGNERWKRDGKGV